MFFHHAKRANAPDVENRRVVGPDIGNRNPRLSGARLVPTGVEYGLAVLENDGPAMPYLARRGVQARQSCYVTARCRHDPQLPRDDVRTRHAENDHSFSAPRGVAYPGA